jgi:exonuclease SbcC
MRIHKIVLRGIGPFKSEQIVDVDEVGQQGLFLLDGPTGVGKSTVVDAIVFALFGSPATDDGKERMVSDYIGDDIPKDGRPFVELTFSVSSGTFRVRREPTVPYVTRNGRSAERNATAQLWRLPNETAGDGESVANKPDEVGREIADLLGLNRDQVLSTIVLAQGEFATFLRAKSEQRRAILQSVFRTERYERLQQALVGARKDAFAQRRESKEALVQALAVMNDAASLGVESAAFAEEYIKDPGAAQVLLDQSVRQLGRDAEKLGAELADLERSSAKAADALAEAVRQSDDVERKRTLLEKRAALDSEATEVAKLDGEVAEARAAAVVKPAHDTQRARAEAAQSAARAVRDLLHALPEGERDSSVAELDALLTGIVEDKAALQALLSVEAGLGGKRARLKALADEVGTLRGAIDRDEGMLRGLPEKIDALTADCETLTPVARGLEAAQLRLKAADQDVAELARIEALRERVAALSRNAEKADALAAAAELALEAARAKYLEGLAAELAQNLEDHQPCPVCGSHEHPSPARPGEDHMSADGVKLKDDEWSMLLGQAVDARQAAAVASAELQTKEAHLGGRDHDAVNEAQQWAKQCVAEAEEAQGSLLLAQKRRMDLQSRQQELTEAVARHKERLAAAAQKHENLLEVISEDSSTVDTARMGFDTVAERDRALGVRRRVLEEVKAARVKQESAVSAATAAHEAFRAALRDSRFVGEADFLAAVRDAQWVEKAVVRVKEHGEAIAGVVGQLESEQLRAVDETRTFDLDGLKVAAKGAKAAADACRESRAQADRVLAKATEHNEAVGARWSAYETVERETRPVIRIANLVTGEKENLHRIPLANYVVMRRFVEVVDAANTHLADMSDGRYRLAATGDAAGKELKIGLGLEVFDDRTDAPRGPSTLSGGETFYVSLALALGLADVVQSEAGGVSLETLFVDEGFGSLDAETLDSVMNVLTRLGRGQRTVGLISHVDELKRRVPDRVEIHRPTPNGPSEIKPQL